MPSADAAVPLPPMLVVLSGPSGAGKDSVLTHLRTAVAGLRVAVTATTRAPRPGEVPGRSYYFMSAAEYRRLLEDGKLMAAAQVHGNWYGVPLDEIWRPLQAGEDVIVKLDVQGAMDVKRRLPQAVFIFLAPPSLHDLVRRLKERHTESPAELERRIRDASFEMQQLPEYDYAVVNGAAGAPHAAEQIASIITAERLRVHRAPVQFPND
jgi:guanylate kinase